MPTPLSIQFFIITIVSEHLNIMSNTNRISATDIKRMSVNESISLNGVDRSEVATITSAITNNNPGYEYNVTKNRRGEVIVTRVVPENMYNRAQYISSINKTTLVRALKQNNNVKTRTGEALGVSARTIGRLMQRHGI